MNTAKGNAIERGVVSICRVVLWLSTLVIFVILCANTVLRYATGSSVQWANEVPELLFPWLVMAGVVLAAVHGAHITTTFMMEVLPAQVRRIVASASWLIVAGLYGTLTVATFRMLDIAHDEKSPILQLPGSITYACVMGGIAMLAVLAVQSAWQAWCAPPEPQSGAEPHVPTAHW